MQKGNIILIHGEVQSGKDTLADMFVFKSSYRKFRYADEVKRLASLFVYVFFGISVPLSNWESGDFKKRKVPIKNNCKGLTYRDVLTSIGTDFMREKVSDNYWVDIVIEKIKGSDYKNFVISDVRFSNEILKIFHDLGNEFNISTIKILRDNQVKVNHKSEDGLDYDFDFTIDNNKSLNELVNSYEKIIKCIN